MFQSPVLTKHSTSIFHAMVWHMSCVCLCGCGCDTNGQAVAPPIYWIFLLPSLFSRAAPSAAGTPPSLIITVIRELCIPGGGLAPENRFCMAWQSSSWPSQGLVGPGSAHGVASPSSFGSHGALHIAKEWSTAQIGSLASLASQKGKSTAPSLPRSS